MTPPTPKTDLLELTLCALFILFVCGAFALWTPAVGVYP